MIECSINPKHRCIKDRITILPKSIKGILTQQKSLKKSDDFLFTGRNNKRLTETSIQKIVQNTATQIYTHVTSDAARSIKSPLDG